MSIRKWQPATAKWLAGVFLIFSSADVFAREAENAPPSAVESNDYVLGPDDQVRVWVLGLEDLFDKSFRIDTGGKLDLPLIGSVVASGLSVDQLRKLLSKHLEKEVRQPRVAISVVEFGSQPVSVLGAVNSPGVHQLRGRKTLVEILSLAGGIRQDAGHSVKISRQLGWDPIPLPSARVDATARYSVADVKLKNILEALRPEENIVIRPHDVITVPRAEMIYVMGAVRKPGAFVLNDQESMSVLQALSLAEGLGSTPAPQNSRILRTPEGGSKREEAAVDLRRVIAGQAPDVNLKPNDILFVPSSTGKRVAVRALEAAIYTGTGIAIWRR